MRAVIAATVTAALLLATSPAIAQPSRTPQAPAPYQYQAETTPRTHRYGTTIAAVDGLSFGLMLVGLIVFASGVGANNGVGDDDDAVLGAGLMIGGMAGYAFGGPLVHSREGNSWGAWKSFAARVGLPFLGVAIGEMMKTEECSIDYCTESEGPGASLSGIGVLSAMVIDWFILAKVDRPVPRYAPYTTTSRDGDVTFGLAGSF